jgi:opacity protein-like surface antigen
MLLAAPLGHAQGLPTAEAKASLWIGGGVTYGDPDYGQKPIKGGSGFADFDLGPHLGVEAAIHYIALVTPLDLAENSYLIGPRFLLRRGRFTLYGKALAGSGDLVVQELQDNAGHADGLFFAYAIGGGVDIRVADRITVRAFDVESQRWPSYGNGLSPTVVTIGAAYHIR